MTRRKISELTATTTPDQDAVIPLVQSGQTLKYKPAFPLNARAFGVSASASAVANTTAIATAVATAASTGLPLFIPPGTYEFANNGSSVCISIGALTNVTIYGVQGATILKVAAGADAHLINIDGGSNITIRDLTIDGNRANQTASAHGIRTLTVTDLRIENVEVKECLGYGIGLQGGTKRRIYLNNLYVHDTGSDGIDSKNTDDDSEELFASNIVVENWGLNVAATTQAGFDCRGPWQVSGFYAKGSPTDGTGIRFRHGALADPSGLGGHRSNLTNFHCIGNAGLSFGVEINANDVSVTNGYVTGAFRGIQIIAERAKVTSVTCDTNSTDGFLASSDAHDCEFIDCKALSNTDDGFEIRGDRNKIIGGLVSGNTVNGVEINAAAADTLIALATFSSNGSNLSNGGTGTRLVENIGLGGLIASSISEDVVSLASSSNIDTALLASTTYLFRIQVEGEDALGNRCMVRGQLRAFRSGSGSPTVNPFKVEMAEVSRANVDVTPSVWLLTSATASGNNLRVSVQNNMGADCHMTIRVWEIDRDATVEDS